MGRRKMDPSSSSVYEPSSATGFVTNAAFWTSNEWCPNYRLAARLVFLVTFSTAGWSLVHQPGSYPMTIPAFRRRLTRNGSVTHRLSRNARGLAFLFQLYQHQSQESAPPGR